MPSITELTNMCSAGRVQEAYELAKVYLEQHSTDLWAQRAMGWVLYYFIKGDVDSANYQMLLAHLDELKALKQLKIPEDNMLFEKVMFKIAFFVKNCVPPNGIESPVILSSIFARLHEYNFCASKGYSFLLSSFIKCNGWQEMADFLDWWNLDKLTQEDYVPYQMDNGRTIMSLAERAFIAKSKALLRLNDIGRIKEFLPKMDNLMETHPEMTYPGYFYGKMLLSQGSTQEEALKVILPFVRKKATEFWVWQLLSDAFNGNTDKQLACLLRAVNCGARENFLGKVRIKLATIFIQQGQLDYAKYQIDKVTQCYLSQGWHLPYEITIWIHQPWINSVSANSAVPIDYMAITNSILCAGTDEAIAIVTRVDRLSHKVNLVYGLKKRTLQRLRFNVGPGAVLKINYINEPDGNLRVLLFGQTRFPTDLDYAKVVEGTIRKREDKDFAFLKTHKGNFYISPNLVRKHELQDNEIVKSLVVFDYNNKKGTWEWICVSINKKK